MNKTVYFTDFVSDVIENIAQSAEKQPHSEARAAIHAVGIAIQQAATHNGINVKIRYEPRGAADE